MTQPHPFSLSARVYYEDTDAGGIVYYVNYLKFMERARTEYLRVLGFSQHKLAQSNILFVVHNCQARYFAPARLDDELRITAQVIVLKRARIEFHQQIYHTNASQLLCEGQFVIACVAANSFRPTAMPKALYSALQHLSIQ